MFGAHSWWSSRKSKQQREEAQKEAERAERALAAAESSAKEFARQANAAERSANADEKWAEIAARQAAAEDAAAEDVTWEFKPGPNLWAFRLCNTSRNTAFHVELLGGETDDGDAGTIGAKSEYGFRVNVHPRSAIDVRVTWYQTEDKSDAMRTWTGTLPEPAVTG